MGILHPNRIFPPTQLAAQAHTATGGRGEGEPNADSRDGEDESQIVRKDIGNEFDTCCTAVAVCGSGEVEDCASMMLRHDIEVAVKHENMKIAKNDQTHLLRKSAGNSCFHVFVVCCKDRASVVSRRLSAIGKSASRQAPSTHQILVLPK